ncbi:MAG: nuclear transport factor 2 family protein [Candidatus Kapaibacterium sp.]
MKYRILAAILTTVLITTGLQAKEEREMEAITEVIEQFKESGDRQNPELAQPILHDNFTLFYFGGEEWVTTTKGGYIKALEAKVIGGVERNIRVEEVKITGAVATAHVQFSSDEALFDQFVNLVKSESGWQIVNIVLNFQPKG